MDLVRRSFLQKMVASIFCLRKNQPVRGKNSTMEFTLRLSSSSYRALKKDDDGWYSAKIDATVDMTIESTRIQTIREHRRATRKRAKVANAIKHRETEGKYDKKIKHLSQVYALNFLGRRKYTIKRTETRWVKFRIAVQYLVKAREATGIDYLELVTYLVRVLRETYVERGRLISPGHFCSKHVWKETFPTWLVSHGITSPAKMENWPLQ
jgi:hypothetical protein